MSDVLAHGREPGRRPPRWLGLLSALLIVAGGGYALAGRDDGSSPPIPPTAGDGTPAASPSTAASTTGSAAPSAPPLPAQPGSAAPGARPWPRREGACGSDAALPLLAVPPLRERTGLRVLVGGHGLRLVDVDTGREEPVHLPAEPSGRHVDTLATSWGTVYALAHSCATTMAANRVLRIDRDRGAVKVPLTRGVDGLLAGGGDAWGFVYSPRIVLRPVAGGAPVRLPAGFNPLAATDDHFLGALDSGDVDGPGGLRTVATVERTSTPRVRPLARGNPLVATAAVILSSTACDAGADCTLTRISPDGRGKRRFPLPRGRSPASAAVLSPDGRLAAFQLARAEPDPRYDLGHPGGPADLAVIDLRTGRLTVLPGVELAAKSFAGLAFSRDSRWLLIALNEGSRARLLVWRRGFDRPQRSPAALPGKIVNGVPVLDAAAWSRSTRASSSSSR